MYYNIRNTFGTNLPVDFLSFLFCFMYLYIYICLCFLCIVICMHSFHSAHIFIGIRTNNPGQTPPVNYPGHIPPTQKKVIKYSKIKVHFFKKIYIYNYIDSIPYIIKNIISILDSKYY